MKKTMSVFVAAAMAAGMALSLAPHAEYLDYYLIGSDSDNNCPLNGRGGLQGPRTASSTMSEMVSLP